jgi:hypothetical protein
MEPNCGPPATTARLSTNGTPVASKVRPKAAQRTDHAPPRDGPPGSWSDSLGVARPSSRIHVGATVPANTKCARHVFTAVSACDVGSRGCDDLTAFWTCAYPVVTPQVITAVLTYCLGARCFDMRKVLSYDLPCALEITVVGY